MSTNRTIQFFGLGFGTEPVQITVTVSGNTSFVGTIPTVDAPLPPPAENYPPSDFVELFTLQVPVEFDGSFPMTISTTTGYGMLLGPTFANYIVIKNPIFSDSQFNIVNSNIRSQDSIDICVELANPPFTQAEIAILNDPATPINNFSLLLSEHDVYPWIPGGPSNFHPPGFRPEGDCRSNVTLNGTAIAPPDPRPSGKNGDWCWPIPTPGVLGFDLTVHAGWL